MVGHVIFPAVAPAPYQRPHGRHFSCPLGVPWAPILEASLQTGLHGGAMSDVAAQVVQDDAMQDAALQHDVMQNDVRPVAVFRRPLKLERRWGRFRCRAWFRDKEFTSDWSSGNFTLWRRVFSPLCGEPLRILEIGSWEGRSAIFFLNFFARATITCIDTFSGGTDHVAAQATRIEKRFDRNLAPFGDRVEKIKGPSRQALTRLSAEGRRYDLAYIDGSHAREDVMADSL